MKKLIALILTLVVTCGAVFAQGKTLIIYFTPANSDTMDAVSAATPHSENASSVEDLVNKISKKIKADVVKIVPKESYPLEYSKTADKAKAEADKNARPAFTLDKSVNLKDYDTVFVGYPIWRYQMPMIMYTFFDTYDFSGKTIIPFNTHLGSRDGGTYKDIAKLEPKATVKDGLAISGDKTSSADKAVSDWLKKQGY